MELFRGFLCKRIRCICCYRCCCCCYEIKRKKKRNDWRIFLLCVKTIIFCATHSLGQGMTKITCGEKQKFIYKNNRTKKSHNTRFQLFYRRKIKITYFIMFTISSVWYLICWVCFCCFFFISCLLFRCVDWATMMTKITLDVTFSFGQR